MGGNELTTPDRPDLPNFLCERLKNMGRPGYEQTRYEATFHYKQEPEAHDKDYGYTLGISHGGNRPTFTVVFVHAQCQGQSLLLFKVDYLLAELIFLHNSSRIVTIQAISAPAQ